ncbi:PREDICTED: uncharacterized protein LOC109180581 [Ipomoea nil]|uniref:uncharacterized protein LOC109180581 n=1 Tax=Ipomoea nil TaxID=35883 RepID=UPI000901D176|nr:PREDICTED: uncharacterized protein LOC109180581 [Ipomoea nil]XP_019185783.1 PREDICTED: uncharacterized protein LOC109180581 [Ipomoea nil]
MAVSLSRFSWWVWGGKEKESVAKGSSVNSLQAESVKLWSVSPSTRKVKRKWNSREERRRGMIDKEEYDVVLVASDDVCLSGSESDDSDWSIGWLEPHAPDFQSDDEADNSFAVLVPCYKALVVEEPSNQVLSAIKSLSNEYSPEGKKYMEQWLSSLQNF